MAIVSNSVVVIELIDGTKLVSDEKVGMNMDEVGVRGCLATEGTVSVFHSSGGYTLVSENDVKSIKTISETINWSKECEWIDSHDGKPSDFFMNAIAGDLSFSQIEEYYENGFYMRNVASKEELTMDTIRSYFRFVRDGGKQTA